MSATKSDSKPREKSELQHTLNEMLDFDTENSADTEFSKRVRQLSKTIHEMNERLDRLSKGY